MRLDVIRPDSYLMEVIIMAREGREGSGKATVSDISKMDSNMESPMNAQKNGPEEGPQAPSGLPNFMPPDPLSICPGTQGGRNKTRPE